MICAEPSFEKKKSTSESSEGFKSAKDDIREWTAVGMMVSFYGLLEEVKDLKPEDSTSVFDMASRLQTLSLGSGRSCLTTKKAEEKICVKSKFEEAESGKRKVEEEIAELKRKILELQRRGSVAEEEKEAAEKKMVD